ncbi:OmcA/MtrC family decaheme c-type cytochrome [Shewanella colwelliana]|uniref:OmcA/MtrC family decaheme c-type cytochrome n=1 Tax=Shewanella colwelliana TaxID=23 RepID=UPI0037359F95
MMKKFNFNAATKAVLGAGLLSLAISGCGSDGKDGEDGKPGTVGTPIGAVSHLDAKIQSASIDDAGFLTINFDLSDANGTAVFELAPSDIAAVSFGRVGTEDEVGSTDLEGKPRDIWLSYFNKDKGDDHYTGSSYFQGKNCETCLTDNGDGTYTLVLDKAIDTLEKYAYDADVTNGIYLGVKANNNAGDTLVDNSFFYWQPSSDTTQDKPKALIANETCQSCHRPGQDGALSMHGGKHVTLESCTFCHTDYNSYMKDEKDDAGTVVRSYEFDGSIKGMAHEIHSHSTFNGIYPQSASNCQTCHQADEGLAMADAWKADLDTATCMNCHNSPYAVPSWHWDSENNQIAESKQNCVSCHNDPNGGVRGAESGHYLKNDKAQAAMATVTFNSMSYSADTKTVTANMTVMAGDTKVTLAQIDPTPYKYGGFTSAIVFNGVVQDDFLVNYQKVGYGNFTEGTEGSINITIADGDFDVAKVMETEGVSVALSSQLHICFDGKGAVADCTLSEDGKVATNAGPYVPSDTAYFAVDGTMLDKSPRIQHAEMTACQQCHTTAIKHRFSNDMDGCASCHNGTRDKKGAGSSNLAYIVHSKHYVYDTDGSLFFKKTECQACHGDNGFSLSKIDPKAAPVAFGTTDAQRLSDTNEQLVVSPQTAACVSCHQAPYGLNDATAAHIQSNGGLLKEDGAPLTTLGVPASEYDMLNPAETCSTCHKDSQILEAHANWGSSH